MQPLAVRILLLCCCLYRYRDRQVSPFWGISYVSLVGAAAHQEQPTGERRKKGDREEEEREG